MLWGGIVSRQHGAPGLSTWTIEAPPQWSGEHLELSKDELSQLLHVHAKKLVRPRRSRPGRIGGVTLGLNDL